MNQIAIQNTQNQDKTEKKDETISTEQQQQIQIEVKPQSPNILFSNKQEIIEFNDFGESDNLDKYSSDIFQNIPKQQENSSESEKKNTKEIQNLELIVKNNSQKEIQEFISNAEIEHQNENHYILNIQKSNDNQINIDNQSENLLIQNLETKKILINNVPSIPQQNGISYEDDEIDDFYKTFNQNINALPNQDNENIMPLSPQEEGKFCYSDQYLNGNPQNEIINNSQIINENKYENSKLQEQPSHESKENQIKQINQNQQNDHFIQNESQVDDYNNIEEENQIDQNQNSDSNEIQEQHKDEIQPPNNIQQNQIPNLHEVTSNAMANQNLSVLQNIFGNINNLHDHMMGAMVLGAQNPDNPELRGIQQVALLYFLSMAYFQGEFRRRKQILKRIICRRLILILLNGSLVLMNLFAIDSSPSCNEDFNRVLILLLLENSIIILAHLSIILYIYFTDLRQINLASYTGAYVDVVDTFAISNYESQRTVTIQIMRQPLMTFYRFCNLIYFFSIMIYTNNIFYSYGLSGACSQDNAPFKWYIILFYMLLFYLVVFLFLIAIILRLFVGPMENHTDQNVIIGSVNTNKNGASQQQLNKLQIEYIDNILEGDNQQCAICLEQFQNGDPIIRLQCSSQHYFHKECSYQWLKVQHLCPLCKVSIFKDGKLVEN